MSRITGNEDILGAVNTAMSICWDETHGYHLGGNMDPDTDCSGLVWYALHNNGFDVGSSRWDTSTMMQILRDYGNFTEYRYTPSFTLKHGDICVHRETGHGHACMIAENVLAYTSDVRHYPASDMSGYPDTIGTVALAKVEAYSPRSHPESGDQANDMGAHTEVFVHLFEGLSSSYNWRVFRWNGGPTPPGQRLPIWMLFKIKEMNEGKEKIW
jgi:hypothetical protein